MGTSKFGVRRKELVFELFSMSQNFPENLKTFLKVLSTPYKEQPENEAYLKPARLDEIVKQTFCGT